MPLFTSRYSTDTAATGAKCSLTGWGTTRAGASTLPTNLQLVYVDIVDHERCAQGYANSQGVDDKMICAGVRGGGKDSCQGDGGGPLVETASGKQVGVVSWGFGCGRHGRDGVYTSTAAYLPWIQEAVLLGIFGQ